MKILLINSHHKILGGAERYYFELGSLLKAKGHDVAYFSMKDNGNLKSKWEKYFVSSVDPEKNGLFEIFNKIPRIFYSFESKRKIADLLDNFKPDIVHLNNIYYHISPSILTEIKKRNIPVIQTVHDYQIISPNVIMYHDGQICEKYKVKNYYKSIFHKCVGGSYIGSFLAVTGLYIQNYKNFYQNHIDLFITPSHFMQKMLVSYGVDKNKIIHLNNFTSNQKFDQRKNLNNRYILFFGRLTDAKGIFEIINLAKELPEIKIIAVGKFDSITDKKYILEKIKNKNIKNLFISGFKNTKNINKLIANSEFVIAPSKWNENQPYAVLEAYACGKAVVASRIGGIPEIVKVGTTGLLFNPGDILDLKKKVLYLWNNTNISKKMGQSARNYALRNFTGEKHYQKLIKIYTQRIGAKLI